MDKLFSAIYDAEEKLKWDKLLEVSTLLPIHPDKRTYAMYYLKNKRQYNIEARDFVEKGFNFIHNGKYYRYSTSIPDSESYKEKQKATTRGLTLFNVGTMFRDPESG